MCLVVIGIWWKSNYNVKEITDVILVVWCKTTRPLRWWFTEACDSAWPAFQPSCISGSSQSTSPHLQLLIAFDRWFRTECDYNAMVLDLLGTSLEDLFNFCNRKFSLKTVLLLDQLVCPSTNLKTHRVEHSYFCRYLELNTSIPTTSSTEISSQIIFSWELANVATKSMLSISVLLRNSVIQRLIYIPYMENKNLTGTAHYTSINTHLGVTLHVLSINDV